MEDLSLKICQSAFFDSCESANEAFCIPRLFAELRFDLSTISLKDIPSLHLPEKLIFTCRSGNLNYNERLKAYLFALDLGVNYIDLDFETDFDLLRILQPKISNSKTQLILSQHNYSSTPDFVKLKESAQKAFDFGADIAKIITTANSKNDLENIYRLYQHFDNLIAFSMGEIGVVSRAKILTLGAPYTYASFSNAEKTAPGQIDFQQTMDLYHKIKTENL